MASTNDLNTPRPRFTGYALDEDNPVLEALLAHRSVRAYKDVPIPERALGLILDAAQRAPTSSNLHSYSIVAVDDRKIRERARDLCGNQAFVAQCGVLLVFCSDISRHIHICAERGYPYRGDQINTVLVAHGDCNLACQNAAVAAQSLGYGTCMLGNVRNDPQGMSDLLGLPKYVYASVGLAIGVPAEDMGTKPRIPRSLMVSRNRYEPGPVKQALAAYDDEMRLSGCYAGRREPLNDVPPDHVDPVPDDAYGWSEHSARRMGGGNQTQRRGLGEFMEGKGFKLL